MTFKSFQDDKASTKAKKAAASSKGFGAAAAKQQSSTSAAAAAAVAGTAELSAEQLAAVVASNTYGDDHLDAALTATRGEPQHSIIGEYLGPGSLSESGVASYLGLSTCCRQLLLHQQDSFVAGHAR